MIIRQLKTYFNLISSIKYTFSVCFDNTGFGVLKRYYFPGLVLLKKMYNLLVINVQQL